MSPGARHQRSVLLFQRYRRQEVFPAPHSCHSHACHAMSDHASPAAIFSKATTLLPSSFSEMREEKRDE